MAPMDNAIKDFVMLMRTSVVALGFGLARRTKAKREPTIMDAVAAMIGVTGSFLTKGTG